MADLAREDGIEPETQPISPEPSPAVLEIRARVGCAHVHDGAPIAGFVAVAVSRWQPQTDVDFNDFLVDVCAACLRLARDGRFVAVSDDRRHENRLPTRSSSSVAEQPADNRQVAAKTTTEEPSPDGKSAAVEASGSIPAMGSTHTTARDGAVSVTDKHGQLVDSWDEHR